MKPNLVLTFMIVPLISSLVACKEIKQASNPESAAADAGTDTWRTEASASPPLSSVPSAPITKSDLLATGFAFGKKVTASSVSDAKCPPENAVDGDPGSYWSSEFKDSAWLAVDLGEATEISRVSIHWERAYAKAFSLQVSTDGQTWTTVYETDDSEGGISEIKFPTVEAQQVRLTCTQRGTVWGNAVAEMQVFE